MGDFKLQLGLNNCSNAEYHSDKTWLSSSSLKTLLKSPAKFQAELTEPRSEVENPSFTEGSLTHSLILEPQQIEKEYAFFAGMRKSGAEFEAFKAANPGKLIISTPQKSRCLAYKRAFDLQQAAVDLVKGGESEQSICVLINEVPIKVRFDYINVDKGYGADVKTSSFAVHKESFRMTMNQYGYGLSAALYSWAAELHYGRPFDFYFIAIAKQDLDCQVFKASQETIGRGRLEVVKALEIYKKCLATGIWPDAPRKDEDDREYIIEEI